MGTLDMDDKVFYKSEEVKMAIAKSKYVIEAMYEMYKQGPEGKPCSVQEVARYYRITRQAVFDIFKRNGYKLRSKKRVQSIVVKDIKYSLKIGKYGKYWRATTGDRGYLINKKYDTIKG